MDFAIRGRNALVLGASSGLGAACVLALAAEGANVALAARRENELNVVAAQANAFGVRTAIVPLDLRDASSVDALTGVLSERLGNIDILVLNGGGPPAGSLLDFDESAIDDAYRLLLRPMLSLLDAFVPSMRERKWGRVVALTSTSVKQPIATLALSNVFRTALIAALKTLARDVARDGVTVNAIATGRILTDRLRSLYGNDAERLRAAGEEVPIGRVAEPDELAAVATFLCAEQARYVTGQTISVDGGLVSGLFG